MRYVLFQKSPKHGLSVEVKGVRLHRLHVIATLDGWEASVEIHRMERWHREDTYGMALI
jgi:hypothetical protein